MARPLKSFSLALIFCFFFGLALAADTTPPTGSISINNNATYTNSANVTLKLSATDTGSGLSQMQFSNNNSTWSSPEAYATTKSWALTSGSGTKNVYVKFKDKSGNWSRAYSDSIILDTVLPTGSISINNGAASTNSINVTLNLSAADTGSGVSQMQFSNNNSTWSTSESYAATKNWTLTTGAGTKTVYAKFKDNAGNWSAAVSDSITLSSAAPALPTINTLNSPTNINSQTITGTKSTDTTIITVSCPSAAVGAVTYPTTTTWSCALSNLSQGNNTISVTAKNAAGNTTAPVTGTIVLDSLGPTLEITSPTENQVIEE